MFLKVGARGADFSLQVMPPQQANKFDQDYVFWRDGVRVPGKNEEIVIGEDSERSMIHKFFIISNFY